MKFPVACLIIAQVCGAVSMAAPVVAVRHQFDIPRQTLDAALVEFSRATGYQVARLTDPKAPLIEVGPLRGTFEIGKALDLLLSGTGFTYRLVDDRTIAISARELATRSLQVHRESGVVRVSAIDSGPLAMAGESAQPTSPLESGRPSASGAAAGRELDEVVVTARKSAERLIDVPLAISVHDAEELSRAGISDMDDVAMATPGLNFISVLGEGLPTPVIRGVAPNNISAESSASIFIDGVYVSGREGLNFSQLDLERIEVVKGPQSAIYGRNSFSGAINFITASPTSMWDNRAEATVGSDGKYLGKLVLSGPIIDGRLGVRFAYGHDQSDGTYKNIQEGGGDVGGYRTDTFQTRLVYTPTDALKFDVIGYYSDDHIDPAAAFTYIPNCENANLLTGAAGIRYRQYCGAAPELHGDSLKVNKFASGQDRKVKRVTGAVTWASSAGTFTSVTAHSEVDYASVMDYLGDRGNDGMALIYNTTSGATGVFRTGQIIANPRGNSTKEFSQELRFATPEDRKARVVVGTYFHDTERDTSRSNFYNSEQLPADFQSFVLGSAFQGVFVNDPDPPPQRLETSRAIAGFAALEGDLTDKLTARAEVRYTSEDKGFVNFTDNNPLTRSRERTWGSLTWRGSVDYSPSENQMFYASVARGEKSGDFSAGTDRLAPGSPLYVLPYDGEKIYAFETGSKGIYLDRRLAIDAAAYYYDWRDMVLYQALTGAPGLPPFVSPEIPFYTNSGDVEIYGLEVSSQYRFTRDLALSISASWTDATIVENAKSVRVLFRGFPSLAPDGDVGGNEAQRQSRWQAAASLTYKKPITGKLSLLARGDINYKGKQFIDETNLAWIDPRTIVNARLGLQGETFSVELWAQNLFNDNTPNSVVGQTFIGNTEMQQDGSYRFDGANTLNARRFDATLNPLRQIGVTFRYHF